jgi:hypothetical protein
MLACWHDNLLSQRGKSVADIEWKPLPALWPSPAEFADVGELMLLAFTQNGAPLWEVRRRAMARHDADDLIIDGGADTFEAAKAAALFEAEAIVGLSPHKV